MESTGMNQLIILVLAIENGAWHADKKDFSKQMASYQDIWQDIWIHIQDSGRIRRQSLVAVIAIPVHDSSAPGAPVPAVQGPVTVQVPSTLAQALCGCWVERKLIDRRLVKWVWLSRRATSLIPILFDSAFSFYWFERSKECPWSTDNCPLGVRTTKMYWLLPQKSRKVSPMQSMQLQRG